MNNFRVVQNKDEAFEALADDDEGKVILLGAHKDALEADAIMQKARDEELAKDNPPAA